MFIVIYGNPVEGLSFVGPFESYDAALRYVSGDRDQWLIAPIVAPPEGDEK